MSGDVVTMRDTAARYLQDFGLAGKLSEQEAGQFIEIAGAFGLNPFKREIYCVAYGEGEKRKLSIVIGYDVFLKRADRSGKLLGWKAWTEGSVKDGNLKALIEIKREGWEEPFCHEVYIEEYHQGNSMWNGKPRTMLKKVVIGQGFRLCFPDEMGGLPYLEEELAAAPDRDVTPEEEPPVLVLRDPQTARINLANLAQDPYLPEAGKAQIAEALGDPETPDGKIVELTERAEVAIEKAKKAGKK